ncbi:hypothetical protein BDZ89DRAFT_1042921 [Hymenopellis radicata]|nr:hypothetical protein BDZ89DRAFT_1042921 [Hymenopellis radicata]
MSSQASLMSSQARDASTIGQRIWPTHDGKMFLDRIIISSEGATGVETAVGRLLDIVGPLETVVVVCSRRRHASSDAVSALANIVHGPCHQPPSPQIQRSIRFPEYRRVHVIGLPTPTSASSFITTSFPSEDDKNAVHHQHKPFDNDDGTNRFLNPNQRRRQPFSRADSVKVIFRILTTKDDDF